MKYYLYLDRKFTGWEREEYSIEAESLDDAVKSILNGNVDSYSYDYLPETYEYLSPEENNNEATIEVFNSDTDELIANNINKKYDFRSI